MLYYHMVKYRLRSSNATGGRKRKKPSLKYYQAYPRKEKAATGHYPNLVAGEIKIRSPKLKTNNILGDTL